MQRVLFAPKGLAPLRGDVAEDPVAYDTWVRRREAERARRANPGDPGADTSLAVPMPVAPDVSPRAVSRTVESLATQTSSAWSLTLVASKSHLDRALTAARRVAPRRVRRTLRTIVVPDGSSESDLFHHALAPGSASPVAFAFPGDVWAPDAVALLGASLSPTGVVYGDEDELRKDGTYAAPRLKPDFSPDFALSTAYVGRPLAIGSSVVARLPRFVGSSTAALEHECALHAGDLADTVTHIPEVLCHRTVSAEPMASLRHVREWLRGHNDGTAVEEGPGAGAFRILRPARTTEPVSLVIPFRDEPRLLRTCVDSIVRTTRGVHADLELVLVDNGSTDPETQTLLEILTAHPDVRVVTDPRPFNWAELNNAAARQARGEVLVFLNNDIEALHGGWLATLCSHAVRPDVGAVGARLVYPDGRLQHCGLVVGMTGAAGHVLGGLPADAPGYLHMAVAPRECSAVTGACLATRRAVFEELDGFDEGLGVDLNDVDFCLRAALKGYRTVYEPAAELVHHESPSRGTAGGVDDVVAFVDRWKGYLADGDPYLNAHLTRSDPSCGLAHPEEEEAWDRWHATLVTP